MPSRGRPSSVNLDFSQTVRQISPKFCFFFWLCFSFHFSALARDHMGANNFKALVLHV